jgi:hypothetical protein
MVGMWFVMMAVSVIAILRKAVGMNMNVQTRFFRKTLKVECPDTEYHSKRHPAMFNFEDTRSWNEISDKTHHFSTVSVVDEVDFV